VLPARRCLGRNSHGLADWPRRLVTGKFYHGDWLFAGARRRAKAASIYGQTTPSRPMFRLTPLWNFTGETADGSKHNVLTHAHLFLRKKFFLHRWNRPFLVRLTNVWNGKTQLLIEIRSTRYLINSPKCWRTEEEGTTAS